MNCWFQQEVAVEIENIFKACELNLGDFLGFLEKDNFAEHFFNFLKRRVSNLVFQEPNVVSYKANFLKLTFFFKTTEEIKHFILNFNDSTFYFYKFDILKIVCAILKFEGQIETNIGFV